MTDAEKVTLSREIAETLTAQGILVPAWMKEVFFCPACENYSYSDWNYTAKSGAWCNKCGEGQLALVPVDFTADLYLIPAVEAWIARQPRNGVMLASFFLEWSSRPAAASIDTVEPSCNDIGSPRAVKNTFRGEDATDEMIALAQAFRQALKAGKEQAHD